MSGPLSYAVYSPVGQEFESDWAEWQVLDNQLTFVADFDIYKVGLVFPLIREYFGPITKIIELAPRWWSKYSFF